MFGIPEKHIDQLITSGDQIVNGPCLSLIEEAGELVVAMAKFENGRVDYDIGRAHIIEEMTHVLISMNLVCHMYGISKKDIHKEVLAKAVKAGFDITNY